MFATSPVIIGIIAAIRSIGIWQKMSLISAEFLSILTNLMVSSLFLSVQTHLNCVAQLVSQHGIE
jgi:hypothetical protein